MLIKSPSGRYKDKKKITISEIEIAAYIAIIKYYKRRNRLSNKFIRIKIPYIFVEIEIFLIYAKIVKTISFVE